MTAVLDGLRVAVSTLTAARFPARWVKQSVAGSAMLWAPVVGAALGSLAAAIAGAGTWIGLDPLVVAVLAVGTLAVTTRGLHLDGLADTADGLGTGRPAADALRVMRASDIGPFGVATVVLVLLAQVAAVAQAWDRDPLVGAAALVVAAATGRLAATLACVRGVPAARGDGLGAWVAGTVPLAAGLLIVAVVASCSAALLWLVGEAAWRGPAAVAAGLLVGGLLLRRCVRRLSGITGDVLGALVEVATTAALLVLAP